MSKYKKKGFRNYFFRHRLIPKITKPIPRIDGIIDIGDFVVLGIVGVTVTSVVKDFVGCIVTACVANVCCTWV